MTDQQQKALRLLGLARRARLLEIGEEPVGIACRGGQQRETDGSGGQHRRKLCKIPVCQHDSTSPNPYTRRCS